tara:strand:+ start:1807 stop:2904 length:1098 start_codon:yes stop_codon:yes gene_type:complete
MANASTTITATGSENKLFTIPFSYINSSHLKFYVDGVDTSSGSSLYTATVQTGGTQVEIKLTSDNSTPAAGKVIKIERNTPITTASVVFSNSSTLKASDLNTNTNQLLFAVQEAADDSANSIILDNTTNYDAQSRRIKNVADPVDNQDAATKAHVSSVLTSNASNVTAAQSAQTAAETAKTAAEAAQTAAETAFDNFDDVYLGAKSSDPATDNDGDALNAGDQYFNTSSNTLKIYNGSSWQDAALSADTVVSKTSGTGSGQLPVGTTGQRDGSPSAGFIRFNSTDTKFEGYNGSEWAGIGGGGPALDGGGTGEESVIRTNKNQISGSVSLTIPSGSNGMSAGPITITSGSSVTVSSGATWHIVGT